MSNHFKIPHENMQNALENCKQKMWNIFSFSDFRPPARWSVTLLTTQSLDLWSGTGAQGQVRSKEYLFIKSGGRPALLLTKPSAYLDSVWLAWFTPSTCIENLNTPLTVCCRSSSTGLLYVVIKTALSVKMITNHTKVTRKSYAIMHKNLANEV